MDVTFSVKDVSKRATASNRALARGPDDSCAMMLSPANAGMREVEALETATVDTREQVYELEAEMAVLAKSVEKYKGAYVIAVRSAEGLKADIETGRVRADRASRLVAPRAPVHRAPRWLSARRRNQRKRTIRPSRLSISAAVSP